MKKKISSAVAQIKARLIRQISPFNHTLKAIQKMSDADRAFLKTAINSENPAVALQGNFTCPFCGDTLTANFQQSFSFGAGEFIYNCTHCNTIQNENGYTQIIELSEFDRAVFGVCISEYLNGNKYTTPAIILRGLTGKVGKGDAKLSKDQRTAILQSIDKLMFTAFDPNIIDAFEKLNYDDGSLEKIVKAPVLPSKRVEKTINGQKADVIYFTDESPLLQIAQVKGQILRYDTALLDVPNQNNTPLVIELKNYILRRIVEIKKHKMTPAQLS